MNIHKHARLTPLRRAQMARSVLNKEMTPKQASLAFRISLRTVFKWVSRYKREGHGGMCDRFSRPFSSPRRTAKPIGQAIIKLRRERLCGAHIAKRLSVSPATVSRVLKRHGLSRLKDLEANEPERRYEYAKPGDGGLSS